MAITPPLYVLSRGVQSPRFQMWVGAYSPRNLVSAGKKFVPGWAYRDSPVFDLELIAERDEALARILADKLLRQQGSGRVLGELRLQGFSNRQQLVLGPGEHVVIVHKMDDRRAFCYYSHDWHMQYF